MSNAEDRSSSVNKDTCLLSRPKKISFAVLRSNVSVPCEAGVQIERCREHCYDLSNQQTAGEQRSQDVLR